MPVAVWMGLIFFATFVAVVAGLIFASRRWETLREEVQETPLLADEPILLRNDQVSSIGFWAALLERFEFSALVKRLTTEAGLNWSAGRCTALMLMSGASTAVVLSRVSWLPMLAALLGGVFASSAPLFYIRYRRQKRFTEFEMHFPDALDSLGRAMRAGHAFAAGMDMVAHESMPPVSTEFRKTLEEWRLGQSWEEALEHLAERVPLTSVSLFVASVHVQAKSGGKLHEILGRISESMREATALEGEIRAISAHGKLTGLILTLIPIGIAVVLHFAAPGHLDVLQENPLGRWMLFGAVAALVAAHFVMRRILDIRV